MVGRRSLGRIGAHFFSSKEAAKQAEAEVPSLFLCSSVVKVFYLACRSLDAFFLGGACHIRGSPSHKRA